MIEEKEKINISNILVSIICAVLCLTNLIFNRDNSEVMSILFSLLCGNSLQEYIKTKKVLFIIGAIICGLASIMCLMQYIL